MLNDMIFILLVFFSNIIQTLTGFAGTMLAMPGAMLLIGVENAKVVLNIMGLVASLYIGLKNWKSVHKKELIKITVLMFMGLLIGIQIFKVLQMNMLLTIYGIMIVGIALKNLFFKKKLRIHEVFLTAILIIAGIIHGMFISGGSLLVVYAAMRFKEKAEFRSTLAFVWVFLNSYLLMMQIGDGMVNSETLTLTAVSLIPLALAIYLGNILHHRIDQNAFMKITYVLLLASGMMLLV
jgi:hypothetical protein